MSGLKRMRGENLRDLMQAIRDGLREDWRTKPRPSRQGPSRVGTCRWRGRLKIPPHAHPLVREMVRIMNRQTVTFSEVAAEAGVPRHAVANWGRKHNPRVDQFDAVLNALGYRLCVEELPE